MRLNKELAKLAKEKSICEEWHGKLLDSYEMEELLDMYVKGIDFCLKNNYPSNDFIRRKGVGKMEHRGIFLDGDIAILNQKFIVALGKTKGIVSAKDFTITELFLKNESSIVLTVEDNAFVMVDMFEDTKIKVRASGDAKVCINHYGGTIDIEKLNNAHVKVIEKPTKTY